MSDQTKLTLGEKRVKVDFNVTGDSTVDKIKQKSAELINLLEDLRTEKVNNAVVKEASHQGKQDISEVHRAISLAQTKIETGCMYGVKAVFID